MDSQSKPNLDPKLAEDLMAMSKMANTLVRFLPLWISSRLGVIELLKESPSSLRNVSSTLGTVSTIGSTVQSAACHPQVGAACRAVGSMITLGVFSGCKKGMSDFNKRRVNNVAGELANDYPETKYLEEKVLELSIILDSITRDLEEITSRSSSSSDQDVSPLPEQKGTFSILDGSSDGYGLFLQWSVQIRQLLGKFLAILKESLEPNNQVSDLLSRNASREVFLSEGEISTWISNLRGCAAAIENARNDARGIVNSMDSLLASISRLAPNSTSLTPAPNALLAVGQGGSSIDGPCTQVPDLDADQNHTNELDLWFRQISHLYTHSVEVARELHRLLSKNKAIVQVRSHDQN